MPHFAWKSGDTPVANVSVDSTGKAVVIPTGSAGEVKITLYALNGGLDSGGEIAGMADAVSSPITLTFAVGQDPFLLIPSSGGTVTIREGQDAVVNWSSNLCQKNNNADGTFKDPTEFQITVTYDKDGESVTAYEATLTTSEETPTISSVTVPWEGGLENAYKADARTCTVTVRSTYSNKEYSATATINMISQPAVITLNNINLYQTDNGSGKDITLSWTLEHFDTTETGGGQFELYVASTNEKFGNKGILSVSGVRTALEGTYTLDIPMVELGSDDPASYRDTYSITVKAKNAAESTWSYSSYVLYVYSREALNILVGGVTADSDLTMSNVEKISKLWADRDLPVPRSG